MAVSAATTMSEYLAPPPAYRRKELRAVRTVLKRMMPRGRYIVPCEELIRRPGR
jgi:hypothetical protein